MRRVLLAAAIAAFATVAQAQQFPNRPVTLIVPDGTWRQAQRVRRRVTGLAEVPCAFVTRDAPSEYRLRRTPDARRLSTMEAIAEALGLLEGARGPAARELLLNIFQVMVDRSLRGRALQRGPSDPRM